jgi:hypothetical protein
MVQAKKRGGIRDRNTYRIGSKHRLQSTHEECAIDMKFFTKFDIHPITVQACESSVSSSVFRATLDHWRELNLTAEFQDCVHRLFKYVSLPQV